jgi:hypothetical protein
LSVYAPVFLLTFVPQMLVIAVLVVALALAFARRDQLGPKAWSLATTGLILMIVVEVSGLVWSGGAFREVAGRIGFDRFSMIIAVYAMVTRVIWITAWAS